jgi:hypothetical protein
MNLVLAYMIRSKLVGRTVEVSGELLDRVDVRPHGVRREVTTLKLIKHQLTKMGQRGILLVTHTLRPTTDRTTTTAASAAPAGLVQTTFRKKSITVDKPTSRTNRQNHLATRTCPL